MAIDVKALADEIAGRVEALPARNVPFLRALRRQYSKRLRDAAEKGRTRR